MFNYNRFCFNKVSNLKMTSGIFVLEKVSYYLFWSSDRYDTFKISWRSAEYKKVRLFFRLALNYIQLLVKRCRSYLYAGMTKSNRSENAPHKMNTFGWTAVDKPYARKTPPVTRFCHYVNANISQWEHANRLLQCDCAVDMSTFSLKVHRSTGR